MSGLVGNPEDRFSHNEAQIITEVPPWSGQLLLTRGGWGKGVNPSSI